MPCLLRALGASLLLVALTGCPENTTDIDRDGVPAGDLDCDDLDPTVNYLAPELCDGIDNDCDGEIDEGGQPAEGEWFADEDGDGVGGTLVEEPGCEPEADGLLPTGDDCDDTNADVFPGAPDTCNGDGLDNDCDGQIDEDEDADDDGEASVACGGLDCDDEDGDIFPGAEELCDGLDNDCDGLLSAKLDEDDSDSDGFLGCLDDCDDEAETTFPDAGELCDEVDNDCDEIIDDGVDGDGDGFTACPTSGGAIDIVVVVDNSQSMEDNQTQLIAQVGTLFDNLVAGAIDYQLIVVTTDDPTARGGIITAGPGARGQFIANATPGTMGSPVEKPIENAVAGALLTSGFLRPGASKAILIVSDEDDQSDFSIVGGVASLLGTVNGVADFLKVSGITGGYAGCSNPPAFAVPSIRTNTFIDATGGSWTPICGSDWFVDLGFDLLPETGTDCDDGSADVFPGAEELCDSLDNDCDGILDEDGDGDGSGPCDATADCDEDNPDAFPGNVEICDGIDNDCDGVLPTEEEDDDEDGVLACDDCDDQDATVFPGAVEICEDGTDQNCNGDDGTGADTTDGDGDFVSECDGDCDDGDPGVRPLAAEDLVDEIDNDCDGNVDGEDQSTPYTFNPNAGLTQFFGNPTVSVCDSSYSEITVTRTGMLLFGAVGNVTDSTPTATEFGQYAPLLAPSWEGPPQDATVDVYVSREPERFSAYFTWTGVGGEPLAGFEAHVIYPSEFQIFVNQATPGDGIIGWSCGDDVPVALVPNWPVGGQGPTGSLSDFDLYTGGAPEGRYVWY